jgi:hypothetical protein
MLYKQVIEEEFANAGKKRAIYENQEVYQRTDFIPAKDVEHTKRILKDIVASILTERRQDDWSGYRVSVQEWEADIEICLSLLSGDALQDCVDHLALRLADKQRLEMDVRASPPLWVDISCLLRTEWTKGECLLHMNKMVACAQSWPGHWRSYALEPLERGNEYFSIALRLFINQ